jgi:hypothetical protein
MSRVIHFEIQASDPERAIAFYSCVFGWQFQKWEGGAQDYWLITTGPESEPGIDGGLARRRGDPPEDSASVNCYACVVQVTDLDATLASITTEGGTVVVPKGGVPGVGWVGYAKDTEGNIFGMMQPDPNAS